MDPIRAGRCWGWNQSSRRWAPPPGWVDSGPSRVNPINLRFNVGTVGPHPLGIIIGSSVVGCVVLGCGWLEKIGWQPSSSPPSLPHTHSAGPLYRLRGEGEEVAWKPLISRPGTFIVYFYADFTTHFFGTQSGHSNPPPSLCDTCSFHAELCLPAGPLQPSCGRLAS